MSTTQEIESQWLAAVESGDMEQVQALLLQHPQLRDVTDGWGNSALMMAALNNQTVLLQCLVEQHGLDVWQQSREGMQATVLHAAAVGNHTEMVKLLMDKYQCHDLLEKKDGRGMTPLMAVVERGEEDMARLLIDQYHAKTDVKDTEGRSCLHMAASQGRLPLVKVLLENQESDAGMDEKDATAGCTALLWAVENGHVDVCRYLIERGADVKAVNKRGRGALSMAVLDGDLGLVKTLVEEYNLDIHQRDNDGYSPLAYSACRGYVETVDFMLSRVSDPAARASAVRDALMGVASNGPLMYREQRYQAVARAAVLRLLINKYKSDIDDKDQEGYTSLLRAVSRGDSNSVMFLLVHCNASVNATVEVDGVAKGVMDLAEDDSVRDFINKYQVDQDAVRAEYMTDEIKQIFVEADEMVAPLL